MRESQNDKYYINAQGDVIISLSRLRKLLMTSSLLWTTLLFVPLSYDYVNKTDLVPLKGKLLQISHCVPTRYVPGKVRIYLAGTASTLSIVDGSAELSQLLSKYTGKNISVYIYRPLLSRWLDLDDYDVYQVKDISGNTIVFFSETDKRNKKAQAGYAFLSILSLGGLWLSYLWKHKR